MDGRLITIVISHIVGFTYGCIVTNILLRDRLRQLTIKLRASETANIDLMRQLDAIASLFDECERLKELLNKAEASDDRRTAARQLMEF